MRMETVSLLRRLRNLLSILAGISGLLYLLGFYFFIEKRYNHHAEERLQIISRLVASELENGLVDFDYDYVTLHLQHCIKNTNVDQALILQNKRIIASAEKNNGKTQLAFSDKDGFYKDDTGLWLLIGLENQTGKQIAQLALHYPSTDLETERAWAIGVMFMLAIIAVLLTFYLVEKLNTIISTPLKVLTNKLKNIDSLPLLSNLSEESVPVELQPLASELQNLFTRVNSIAQENFNSREQLLSTLSSMDDIVLVISTDLLILEAYIPTGVLPYPVPKNLNNMPLEALYPMELAEQIKRQISGHASVYSTTRHDYELNFNGVQSWWSSKISRRKDSHGRYVGVTIVARNITPDKLQEQKIKDQEEILQGFIEQSAEGLIIIDKDGIIRRWNKAQEELSGIQKQEAIGAYIWDIQFRNMHPEQQMKVTPEQLQKGIKVVVNEIAQTQRVRFDEVLMRHVGGRDVYINQVIFPIQTSQGFFMGVIIRDVTERRNAQLLLIEKERNLQLVIDAAPFAAHLWRKNSDGNLLFMYANRSADALLQLEHANYFGMLLDDIFTSSEMMTLKQRVLDIIDNKLDISLPAYEMRTPIFTGTLELSSVCLNDTDVVFFFRDITEKYKTEKALEDANAFVREVMHSMPFGIISIDRSENVLLYNSEAEKFADNLQTPNLMHSEKLFTQFPDLHFINDHLKQFQESGEPVRKTVTRYNQEDEEEAYLLSIIPIGVRDESGSLIIIENITQKMLLDQYLVQSEKLASLGSMAAGMAHEINNPLGTIVQGCQNILRRLSAEFPKNIEAAKRLDVSLSQINSYLEDRQIFTIIESMRESVHKASEIIASMLHFSRKSESKRVNAFVQELLENALSLSSNDYDLKKKYDFRNITIRKEYTEPLPSIWLNRTEIEQVFLNILRNAAQALGPNSSSGAMPEIKLKIYQEQGYIVTEISDNGPGMSENTIRKIFEPFFTTKDIGEGTGLGLSVCYSIVTNNHSGKLLVESKIGRGATFKVYLPIKMEKSE